MAWRFLGVIAGATATAGVCDSTFSISAVTRDDRCSLSPQLFPAIVYADRTLAFSERHAAQALRNSRPCGAR